MEILLLTPQTIRIKGKKGSVIVDPVVRMQKTSTDAVIVFQGRDMSSAKVDGYRIVIEGPGEYEVATLKIKAEKNNGHTIYNLTVDGVELLLLSSEDLEIKNKFDLIEAKDYHGIVLNVSSPLSKDILTGFNAKTLILYGEHALAHSKSITEKERVVNKMSLNLEKTPSEMETIILQ